MKPARKDGLETKQRLVDTAERLFAEHGLPGVSLRAGSSANGLPVGVQVVAAPWREDRALALALRIETLMGGFQRPPL